MPPSRGGAREGAGRKNRYGAPTSPMRIPNHLHEAIRQWLAEGGVLAVMPVAPDVEPPQPLSETATALQLPEWIQHVPAGFANLVDEFTAEPLDLQQFLAPNAPATFVMRARGNSMVDKGIFDGSLLVVDRSIAPQHGRIVIAAIDGGFTVKTLYRQGGRVALQAANPTFPDIVLHGEQELVIWGVVTRVINEV